MTDDDLIGYCDLHCKTPRALFNGNQINRMISLAGSCLAPIPEDSWISLHETMEGLVRAARKRKQRVNLRIVTT